MHEKIGVLGGSFNPIHYGHLAMAQAARSALSLDRLLIIPDGDPPHKSRELAGKWHRLKMTELAAAGHHAVSSMEIERPGKTYTVDTLEVLHALYPTATLYMIIGADTLHEIHTWKNAERVFALCQFAVFARDGLPIIPVPGATVLPLEAPIPNISATEIRARVHKGFSLEGYTPQAVQDYIGLHRLYDPPVPMDEKAIRRKLKDAVPPRRYKHILGVEETMLQLATAHHYEGLQKVRLTALLHDCAKGMPLEAMRACIEKLGVQVDPMEWSSTALLHGPAGAGIARAIYGVTDPEILHAIRYHTTGVYPAGKLDKLLWVADMIEPGRKAEPWLDAFRKLAASDLDAAAQGTILRKIAYNEAQGKPIYPGARRAFERMQKENKGEGTA